MPNWLKAPNIQKVFELLSQNGGEGWIVGGAVRDHLLGVKIGDIDFCSTHTPQNLMAIAKQYGVRYIETGVKYGTLTLLIDDQLFEVTSLRQDVETDGRHAKVVYGTDFKQDAMRRDFTLNALYMDAKGKIFDPLDSGLADLAERKLKFIGDAKQRIEEDYLRILRYFRFIARFNFKYDAADYAQIQNLISGLNQLSAERILSEFKRLYESEFLINALTLMSDCNIFEQLFKSKIQLSSLPYLQNSTLSFNNIWLIRFKLSFPNISVEHINNVLKLSKKDQKLLNQMNHLPNILSGSDSRLQQDIYRFGKQNISQNLIYFAAETNFDLDQLKHKLKFVERFEIPIFPVKGADLFAQGFQAGPEMGQTIKRLETLWLEAQFKLSKTDLLKAI